jgi:formate hydrogenlyase subunit 3/multisubunit Na+/H+ antiporter MnhD subunit
VSGSSIIAMLFVFLHTAISLSLLGMRVWEGERKEIGRAHSAKSLKVNTFAEAFYSIFFGTKGWVVGFQHPHSID